MSALDTDRSPGLDLGCEAMHKYDRPNRWMCPSKKVCIIQALRLPLRSEPVHIKVTTGSLRVLRLGGVGQDPQEM